MSQTEQIDAALVTLVGVLGDRLAVTGWSTRPVGVLSSGAFTRPTPSGLLATAEIRRNGGRIPDDWPVELRLVLGVGYEPALALSPLVTAHVSVIELADRAAGWMNGAGYELSGPDAIPALAETLASRAEQSATGFADTLGVDALIAAQAADRTRRTSRPAGRHLADPARPTDSTDDQIQDPATDQVPSRAQLVVLAAAGRLAMDDTPLRRYEDDPDNDADSNRRFIRQLRRWLDAGSPPPPPLEQTLTLLPDLLRRPPTDRAGDQARASAKREAHEAVLHSHRGATEQQVRDALTAEYAGRGLASSDWETTLGAEMLHLQTRPLGRARAQLRGGILLGRLARQAVHRLRHLDEQQPDWLRPPGRATYPLRTGSGFTRIRLDPGTVELLDRAAADTTTHLAHTDTVQVWLRPSQPDPDQPGEIAAHIGEHRVGVVPSAETTVFSAALRAAALFDEDIVATGLLTRTTRGPLRLDVASPAVPAEKIAEQAQTSN